MQMMEADLYSFMNSQQLRSIYSARNTALRDWAHSHPTGRVAILDYDAIARADNSPRGLIGNYSDPHYGKHSGHFAVGQRDCKCG